MKGSSVAKGVLLTAGGAVCWGFSGTCAQLLMDIYGVPLAWNVCVRLVFASLLYLVFCTATHREALVSLLKQPRELGKLLLFSIFGVLLVQVCYQGCISVSNAGVITVTAQNIGSGVDGQTITLSPFKDAAGTQALANGDVGAQIALWKCAGSITSKFRPASCR